MANIFERFGDWMAHRVAGYINDAMSGDYSVLGEYYQGNQRPPLKVKIGQQSDNVISNFVGLAVDRSVSRLFRGGVQFNLPEGAEAQDEYLGRVWDVNKKEIILYQVALHGAVYGTLYFKISPDALTDPYTGNAFPRLIAVDPEIIRMRTAAQDMNEVVEYRIEYTITEQATSYREITRRANEDDGAALGTWVVENWEQVGSGAWKLVNSVNWPYTFPPILHAKNLPSLKSCYGSSDVDDSINIQDKYNFVTSNLAKIIKHHASPKTIGTGFSGKSLERLDDSPDSMWTISGDAAKVFNLEMQSDLANSRSFALDLRQAIFDVSREVDISSMADKLGALTNFGLQVLWSDAIDKNDTKRQLYGAFLLELNRRLLVLAGFEAEASNPGAVAWGNALPVNIMEDVQADQIALGMGIIDKASVAARYEARYGKDWEEIQEALAEEGASANAANADIGAQILRNFNRGEGVPQLPPTNGRQA